MHAQLDQLRKTRQKLDWKNSGNLQLVIFIPATVWQIFNTMMHKQWPEMEIESTEICLKKFVKSSELILWRDLAIWNHCGTGPRKAEEKSEKAEIQTEEIHDFYD